MNKQDLKKYLIKHEASKVVQTKLSYTDYLCGNGRACDQILDLGDEALLVSNNEILDKLEVHLEIHKKRVKFLEEMSFKSTSVIELGAIIETKNINLIIATSIPPFEYENKQFVGLSLDAPLYKCLEGKIIGNECIYNGVKFFIKNIY